MPELNFFYPNCDCCSGSGSSGSGSCNCVFYKTLLSCPDATHCPTEYVATIRLNFTGCGSSPIGSCSTGSSGSSTGGGPSTGGDFEPTGSASGSDCRVCPDCCSIASKVWQINLQCVDSWLASDSFIGSAAGSCFGDGFGAGQTGSDTCVGFRNDRCVGGQVGGASAGSIAGIFVVPMDGGYLYVGANSFSVSSCDPFLMSGIVSAISPFWEAPDLSDYNLVFPCLSQCLDSSYLESGIWSCVTGTVTITEA